MTGEEPTNPSQPHQDHEKPPNVPNADLLKTQYEIWAKAVDTQMHFNEMCVKSRQLGLAFAAAALGLAAFMLSKVSDYTLGFDVLCLHVKTHPSWAVVLIGAFGVAAVRQLDVNVYHRMLRGAVEFGQEFESKTIRPNLMKTPHGMNEFISMYSRHRQVVKREDGTYVPTDRRDAEKKIRQFYRYSIGMLLVIAAIVAIATTHVSRG
jgi:hypothetical protein